MTLDEAIKRFSDNAEYERTHGNLQGCLEFRQLAECLEELKELKEQDAINRQKAEDYKAMVREYHKRKEEKNDTGRKN